MLYFLSTNVYQLDELSSEKFLNTEMKANVY